MALVAGGWGGGGQDFRPQIHLTESDFNSITDGGRLCGPGGRLNQAEFETVMRSQADAPRRPLRAGPRGRAFVSRRGRVGGGGG